MEAALPAAGALRVSIFRNLTRRCYSVQAELPQTGWRTMAHASHVQLTGATFFVSEAARQRVVRTRKRTVHAAIEADLGVWVGRFAKDWRNEARGSPAAHIGRDLECDDLRSTASLQPLWLRPVRAQIRRRSGMAPSPALRRRVLHARGRHRARDLTDTANNILLEFIMGSTVTTGRMAAAFRAPSGTVIYCLYEQTYEKNCYPHSPHWSAVYIGGVTGALQKVFNHASCCEGGMLQNRAGWITPEGYLRSWMSELRSPVRMTRDHGISLYVKNDSLYAPVSHASLPAVTAALAAAGMQDAAARLHAGEHTTLSLFEHGEFIGQLIEDHEIYPWRLLPDYTRPAAGAERCTSLGIAATKTRIESPDYKPALIVSAHGDMILRDANGVWRCGGSRSEIMAAYIQNLAPTEQARPGSHRLLIQSYRSHLKAARKADPGELTIRIDKRLAADTWEIKRIEEAAALPGAWSDGAIIVIPFTTEHEYALTHLPRAATTWQVLDRSPSAHNRFDANQTCLG